MNLRIIASSAAICALLSACANPPPISANPIQNVNSAVSSVLPGGTDIISQGIQNAQYNFNQAVALGILSPTDPAPGCLNSVATLMGLNGSPAPSFVPKITDAISAGSVGYIYLQQLKTVTGGTLTVSPQCQQLIGQIVIDATRAGAKAGVGILTGGVLSGLPIPLGARAPQANPSLNGR